MKFDMNIKTKLTVSIGVLVAMIVLLVSLSVTNLQILTATEPDSPAAEPGMNRASVAFAFASVCGFCLKFPTPSILPLKV